jgi:serine/threonine-protein kinase
MTDRPQDRTDARPVEDSDRTDVEGDQPVAPDSAQSLPPTVRQESGEHRQAGAGSSESNAQARTTDSARSEDSPSSSPPADVPVAQPLSSAGLAVGGYDVLGLLGQGATGVVYRARQRALKRLVALKMISGGPHASFHERARFRAEAEAAARLQHANIIQIHEIGEHEGRPFFSLELIEGGSLARKIDGAPQPPPYAAEVVRTLAGAMEYAHRQGIIHRDLKPGNILLTADGTPKIADFGLAKLLEEDSVHTQTGTIMGTPSYMSPEQAEGDTRKIGPPADVYALGAILYDLLTGRPPFKGTSLWETVNLVKTQEPVPPRQLQPGVPLDLETICLKCLQKDIARRYARAADLADDLRRFLAGEPIQARPLSSPERLWRWCRRNPWLSGLGSAAALLLAAWAITSTFLYFAIRAEQEQTERQRQIATENEAIATQNETLARQREVETNEQRKRAEKNAESLRDQFFRNVNRVHALVEKITVELQPKGGRPLSPEMARLRKDLLELSRSTMMGMARDFQAEGISPFGMVLVSQKMGDLLRTLGQTDEARQQYQLGVDAARAIVKASPKGDLAPGNLAFMLAKLGEGILESSGEVSRAAECFREALQINAGVLAKLPPKPATDALKKRLAETYRNQLHYHHKLTECAGLMWDPADVRRCLATALTFWAARSRANPKDPGARSYLAQTNSLLGDACSWCGDRSAAEKYHKSAIQLCQELIKDFPAHISYSADLAFVSFAYADALLHRGQSAQAGKLYWESLPKAEAARNKKLGDPWIQFVLAHCDEHLGIFLLLEKKEPLAAEPLARSLKEWEDLARKQPANLAVQAVLCVALARSGKYALARQKAENLLLRAKNRPEVLIPAARCFALCAADPGVEKRPLVEKAVGLLQQAGRQGYRNVAALKSERDWQVLAANSAFSELTARLAKSEPGK